MNIEFKTLKTEIKAMDDMTFEGYASVFGNLDSYRDVVMKGAFAHTISNNKNRIKVLWQHDTREPIGKPIEMVEDEKGLYVRAKLCNTDTGRKCYELMKDGVINELSIGYDVIQDDYNRNEQIRYLKEIRLWEFSAVTFAANEMATVNSVKTIDNLLDEIKAGRVLSSGNRDKIKNAIDALMALLDETDPDNSSQKHKEPPKTEFDPDTIQSILHEIKKYQN